MVDYLICTEDKGGLKDIHCSVQNASLFVDLLWIIVNYMIMNMYENNLLHNVVPIFWEMWRWLDSWPPILSIQRILASQNRFQSLHDELFNIDKFLK